MIHGNPTAMDFHYTSGIILFFSSVIGCLLPFQRKVDLTPIRPLSTGIVFAVAICHLLPDSSQILDTNEITEWFMGVTRLQGSIGDDGLYDVLPVAETLMCLGIFIMLVIDQCIPCPHHQVPSCFDRIADYSLKGEEEKLVVSNGDGHHNHGSMNGNSHHNHGYMNGNGHHNHGSMNGNGHHKHGSITNGNGHHHYGSMTNGHHHHGHSHHGHSHHEPPKKIANAKVYATEIAIAIHSIIIGFTMGVDPNTDSLMGLTIAMVFHQLFEGVALAMIALQGSLSLPATCAMVLMFASSLPTGILVGMYAYRLAEAAAGEGGDEDALDMVAIFFQGVPNAIAAGMLLHIGFELMMEDFNHKEAKFPTSKLILVFVGGSMICFLAIWA